MQLLLTSKKFHPEATQLFRTTSLGGLGWTHVYGLATTFEITQPALLKTSGHLNLRHTGKNGWNGVVAYSVNVGLRYAATLAQLPAEAHGAPPPFIRGACSSGNCYDITHHYAEPSLGAQTLLTQAGAYRASVWGVSYSSGAPTTDGLMEVNGDAGSQAVWDARPYHQFIVDLWEAPPGTVAGPNQMTSAGLWS